MHIHFHIDSGNLKINKVIKYFIIADLIFLGGWGLVGPIFSIFILKNIVGATLVTVGITSAIYWIVKSLIQIPVAIFIDKREGEKDDFYTLVFSLLLAGFSAILFMTVHTIVGLYVVQFIYAVSMGLYIPSWSAIFSRHIDKTHAALNWSLDSTFVGLTYGTAALIGGVVGKIFGFQAIFVLVGVLSFVGSFVLFSLPQLILPKSVSEKTETFRDHKSIDLGR